MMIVSRSISVSLVFASFCPLLAVGGLFDGLFPTSLDIDDVLVANPKENKQKVIEFTPLFSTSFLRTEPSPSRHLLESCDSEYYTNRCAIAIRYSGCGVFLNEKSENFCYDDDLWGKNCCGNGSGDCCSVNVGAVVGVIIAAVFLLALSIFGCCFCCTCCCCHDRLRGKNNGGDQQPATPIAAGTPIIEEKNVDIVEQPLPTPPDVES